MYAVLVAASARRELERLEARVARRIITRIEALGSNPRPAGCRKLHGVDNVWRIRVGDHRVIYSVHDDSRTVDVSVVRHRSDAYR